MFSPCCFTNSFHKFFRQNFSIPFLQAAVCKMNRCTRVEDFPSLVADAAASAPSPLPRRRFQPLKRCKTMVRFTNPEVADRSRLTFCFRFLFISPNIPGVLLWHPQDTHYTWVLLGCGAKRCWIFSRPTCKS